MCSRQYILVQYVKPGNNNDMYTCMYIRYVIRHFCHSAVLLALSLPDYDDDGVYCVYCYTDCTSTYLIMGTVIAVVVLIVAGCVALCCIRAIAKSYRKKKDAEIKDIEIDDEKHFKAREANDKTMEIFLQLLQSLYDKLDKVPEDMIDLIREKIDQYSKVLDDIARLQARALDGPCPSRIRGVNGDDGGVIGEDGGVICEDGGVICEDGGVICEDGGVICEDGGVICEDGGVICEDGGIYMCVCNIFCSSSYT